MSETAAIRMVLWCDVRRGDYIRDAGNVVWQVFSTERGNVRIYNPDHGIKHGHPNMNAAIEMVQRGDTGAAVDMLRSAGFNVQIVREDPITSPSERPTHHESS